jgi:dihydrofolate synthase/folylpolyglutamate synthase
MAGPHQLNNAAAAITAVECLHDTLPVAEDCIRQGLSDTALSGRFEQVATAPAIYLDVAHNPAAALELHGILQGLKGMGRLIAVFAMQSSRQVKPFIAPLINDYNQWCVAPLANGLGYNASQLESVLEAQASGASICSCASVASALQTAREGAGKDDIIVVFGSFYTVAEARASMHV